MHKREILISEYKNRYSQNKLILLRALLLYYRDPNFRVIVLMRGATQGRSESSRRKCSKKLMIKYGVTMSTRVTIGKNLEVAHYNGIVLGPGVVIGDNCKLYQQVTLGQKNDTYPKIGNNVTVYAGAKIIGDVHVGNNAVIGANAVVIHDVPDGCTAVGVPARNI